MGLGGWIAAMLAIAMVVEVGGMDRSSRLAVDMMRVLLVTFAVAAIMTELIMKLLG